MTHARKSASLSVSSAAASSKSSNGLLPPRTSMHRGLLLPSPPPSPGLPSLLPRHGKKLYTASFWRFRRPLTALLTLLCLTWLGFHLLRSDREPSPSPRDDRKYEMVGEDILPAEPSAVIVTDRRGRKRWTASIPAPHGFPLRPWQYQDLCAQSEEISQYLAESAKALPWRRRGYYQVDPYFMDVQEAEQQGLLPRAGLDRTGTGGSLGICDRTLTYVLETSEAGLGRTLLDLWLSYGLAQKEGRAFFIDDTRWSYGSYTTYFTPPPVPTCLPPPRSHILPCPHSARHIVVSAATNRRTFGAAFAAEFEDSRKTGAQRQRRIFGLVRAGYEALFRPADAGDAKYVEERVKGLYGGVREKGGMSVAIHVRRGDRHPWEYQYQRDYLPLNRFMEEARTTLARQSGGQSSASGSKRWPWGASSSRSPLGEEPRSEAELASQIVLASDDPDMYTHPEMAQAARAQDRIMLASKATLEAAAAPEPKADRFVDEVSGWEGGFFGDVFWNIGRPRGYKKPTASPSPSTPPSAPASESGSGEERVPAQVVRLRELVARAYLLDLAVLGKADAVVCAVSAAGCRILAVVMGWEVAIKEERWRNVDDGFPWRVA